MAAAGSRDYVPDRGDIVWLTFTPQAGREQSGRRPALVLSPVTYNRLVGLAILCPITRQKKGYPFEVVLPRRLAVQGVVLSDHVKSLDWRAREIQFVGRVTGETLAEVAAKLRTLFP